MKYDTIIYVNPESILEDNRTYAKTVDWTMTNQTDGVDNKSMYASYNYGRQLQNEMKSLGDGFSGEVTDYGKWVTVNISYHNHVNGKTVGKTFLIVFDVKGNSVVFSTANRWRTASGIGQAISYIRSVCSGLRNQTNNV